MYDKEDWITAENVNDLVRGPIGILSIDIDGNDYWIWKALKADPDVICIEYNPWFGPNESWTIRYSPENKWDHTDNYGASLTALYELGKSRGYQLVGCDSTGVNAFFVKKNANLPDLTPKEAFVRVRSPKSGGIIDYSRMVIPQP